MQSSIAETLGIDPDLFHWVLVPMFIFLARIGDVSVSTIRIMFMMAGRKGLAPVLGFCEALIWLIAISQILQNVSSIASYVAYAGGFATGILVGMSIEERLALGNVIVRVITQRDADALIKQMQESGYRLTTVAAEGSRGAVSLIFAVVNRKQLGELTEIIRRFNPNAFYTVENIRYVSEPLPPPLAERPAFYFWEKAWRK
ncbi:Uncharacterized protein YebE, UPF0316 family [Catalinimonas alkaloidigena]|uniref:UPF0316 protein SAMN05421823_103198 n=1 Tax=Catalinimonas alkaloidigena TaxID=1075417 RepID=A0A1G9DP03_9BACT|nr:DUF2179 domain-containing protein [Catalinimonas alkaloidigena]SDK65592.1 Uncharacterized protein YebE, UPF0316 family [Catalinimonas alkaloidigena]